MDVEAEVLRICSRARAASRVLASCPRAKKDEALEAIARGLADGQKDLLAANRLDVDAAEKAGTSAAMVDRLRLDERRLGEMAVAVRSIAGLDDPIGTVIERRERPNGLVVVRVRAPLGVIAMIYEARPNVTVEASALCLKAGNAVVLRGGIGGDAVQRRARRGRRQGARSLRLPEATPCQYCRSPIATPSRPWSRHPTSTWRFLAGGEPLIRFVTEHARVPVVQHYKGVCHLFVDPAPTSTWPRRIAVNAKLSRPGVCNALECLLVDAADAARVLPAIAARLLAEGCELRGDASGPARSSPRSKAATDDDYGREFLDRVLAVRTVDALDGALAHIARYGSGHTEAICTPSEEHALRFQREVDAACVVVNASTRFHDGGELGLGAELGIATSRLHWRGPMGLEALTTMKWLVLGKGQSGVDGTVNPKDDARRTPSQERAERLTEKKRGGRPTGGAGDGGRPTIPEFSRRPLARRARPVASSCTGRGPEGSEAPARLTLSPTAPPASATLPPVGRACERRGPHRRPARRRPSRATRPARSRSLIATAAIEKKALGVEVLDVAGKVDYADFLVLMTGRSDRQVQALAQGIEEELKKHGKRPPGGRGAAPRALGAHGLRRRGRPRVPGRRAGRLRSRRALDGRAADSGAHAGRRSLALARRRHALSSLTSGTSGFFLPTTHAIPIERK